MLLTDEPKYFRRRSLCQLLSCLEDNSSLPGHVILDSGTSWLNRFKYVVSVSSSVTTHSAF